MESQPALKPKSKVISKLIIGVLSFVFLLLIFLYVLQLIEPSSTPQNVLVSNVTDHQVTISWTTRKATKGTLIIAADGNFPLLPSFAQKIYRDDGEKRLNKTNFYTTHYITIDNLSPNQTYQFIIYQGWKKKVQSSFATGSTLPSINTPIPVYGRVLAVDQKPVIGALIYFHATNEASGSAQVTSSALLSALTNNEGRWAIDLANLRTAGLENSYLIGEKTIEEVTVDTGINNPVKAWTSTFSDNPWPDIILKN